MAIMENSRIGAAAADRSVSCVSRSAIIINVKQELSFALVLVTARRSGCHNGFMGVFGDSDHVTHDVQFVIGLERPPGIGNFCRRKSKNLILINLQFDYFRIQICAIDVEAKVI